MERRWQQESQDSVLGRNNPADIHTDQQNQHLFCQAAVLLIPQNLATYPE